MKLAILGTRGIPNNYGGFERAAEEVAVRLAQMGHDVTVYNPDDHPFPGDVWRGVKIKRVFCRERSLGIWGTFLFDYLCLRDALRCKFDVILELGCEPAAVFFWLARGSQSVLVTNIDGLGWKRSKWSKPLRWFIRHCERIAVRDSDALIADNPGIQSYCLSEYGKHAQYIPYGAVIPAGTNKKQIQAHGLREREYYMLVARLEPENNIEIILDGYLESGSKKPFIVVGGLSSNYARYLLNRYKHASAIKFVGGIYDYEELSGLRHACEIYFHGHSVGGTNPSLLEAMASKSYIVAHDNIFNRGVMGGDALYFSNSREVAKIIHHGPLNRDVFQEQNVEKIQQTFNWEAVARQHEIMFERCFAEE